MKKKLSCIVNAEGQGRNDGKVGEIDRLKCAMQSIYLSFLNKKHER